MRLAIGGCVENRFPKLIPPSSEAILHEVDQLHGVGARLEKLSEHHPTISDALITIAANVRNTATVLGVLVVTKSPKPI